MKPITIKDFKEIKTIINYDLMDCEENLDVAEQECDQENIKHYREVIKELSPLIKKLGVFIEKLETMEMKTKKLGSIKDLLHDLESDIAMIKDWEQFKEDKEYLFGWIKSIRDVLGLEEK